MTTTYSPSLKLALIGDGEQSGIWGQTTNTNLGTLLEQAITGVTDINMSDSNYTLSDYNGAADESRNAVLVVKGSLGATRDIIAPTVQKLYVVKNATNQSIRIKTASGTAVTIPTGVTTAVYCDGADFYVQNNGTVGSQTINGNLTVTGTASITGNLAGSTATFSGGIGAVSPIFTGTPLVPTAAVDTNTLQAASTEFVLNQGNSTAATIAMNGSQAAGTSKLYARADHVHPTDTSRAPLDSPAFTGTPTSTTPLTSDDSTRVATTAFVVSKVASSGVPTFSGGTTGLTPIAATSGPITLGGVLSVANGGTGTSAAPSNGQLLIGNGTGYTRANLTQGTGISITNSAGGITIAATGSGSGVTSVGLAAPALFTVSNSPVTSTGTLTLSYSGSALPVANGGTGSSTLTGAGLVTTGDTQTITASKTFNATTFVNSTATSNVGLVIGAAALPQASWGAYILARSGGPGMVFHGNTSNSYPITGLIDGSLCTTWAEWFTGTTASVTDRGGVSWNGSVIVYSGTSDYRLKENVVPLSNAITKLKALKPVQFTWKEFPDTGSHDGFIAHEFQEVIPDGVVGKKDQVDKDGKVKPQGLDASFAIPVLTKALQEAITRIETLEAQVAALKGA